MARFVQVQIENQLNGITIISPCKFRHGGPTARLDGLKSSDVDVDVLGPGNPWGFRFLSFPRCFFLRKAPKKDDGTKKTKGKKSAQKMGCLKKKSSV